MILITRYDPSTRGFDDVFNGMFLRPMRFNLDAVPELQIKLRLPKKAASASRRITVN